MSGSAAQLSVYRKFAELQLKTSFAYRWSTISGLAVVLLRIVLLTAVWTTVYSGQTEVDGIPLPTLLTFITLGNLQLLLMRPMLVWYIQRRIHEGQIALDLVRPVPFLGQLVAQQVGATVGLVPFVLLGVVVAAVLGQLGGPASPAAAVAYLASLTLAYMLSILIGLLMGLVAFWTVQSLGVGVIYEFASQFFGGALIPLAFFPPLLLGLARLLPFQALVSIPVSIYTGSISSSTDLAAAFGLQVFWVVALALLVGWVWRYARRVVTVQGG
jgi:viologen exporter family transport system permease protein